MIYNCSTMNITQCQRSKGGRCSETYYFMWFSVFLACLRIIVLGNCNKSLYMCCLDLGQRLMSMLSVSVTQHRSAREFWSREAVVPLGSSGLLGPAIWEPGFNCSAPITCKETKSQRGGVLIKVTWFVSQNSSSYGFSSETRPKSLSQRLFSWTDLAYYVKKSQVLALRAVLHEVLCALWAWDVLRPFYFQFGFLKTL